MRRKPGRPIEQTPPAAKGYPSISTVLADAIFASGLQRPDEPNPGQVRRAATAAIRAYGSSGCAGRVAQEFGDHPETAAIRMRWARSVAREAFPAAPSELDSAKQACSSQAREGEATI
jgi:hypothetical protein